MSTMIFVNLPVTDLDRSKAFYEALGWSINPMFTDENAACVVISDTIMLMILRRDFFQTFTSKEVADPRTTAQALIALSRDSREAVAEIAATALASGGSESRPAQDYGFMVQHAIEDPDGNVLEFMWMDPKAAEQGPEAWATQGGADS